MSEPRWLLLETSQRGGWVALAEGRQIRRTQRLDASRRHARDLAPAVRQLLRDVNWTAHDVQAVAVGRGPGGYTGLRVGLISAASWAYATSARLIVLNTFDAIAAGLPDECSSVDILADAQQEHVYVQSFTGRQATAPLGIRPLAEWLRDRCPTSWVAGPALRTLRAHLPADARVVPEAYWEPQPEGVLHQAQSLWEAGADDSPLNLEPLYLRPSSAELNWDRRFPPTDSPVSPPNSIGVPHVVVVNAHGQCPQCRTRRLDVVV